MNVTNGLAVWIKGGRYERGEVGTCCKQQLVPPSQWNTTGVDPAVVTCFPFLKKLKLKTRKSHLVHLDRHQAKLLPPFFAKRFLRALGHTDSWHTPRGTRRRSLLWCAGVRRALAHSWFSAQHSRSERCELGGMSSGAFWQRWGSAGDDDRKARLTPGADSKT